jgi:hypothetical protein
MRNVLSLAGATITIFVTKELHLEHPEKDDPIAAQLR